MLHTSAFALCSHCWKWGGAFLSCSIGLHASFAKSQERFHRELNILLFDVCRLIQPLAERSEML